MGLLDGILGDAVGSMLGGRDAGGSQNPLDSVLSTLGVGNAAGGAGVLTAVMAMLQQHGGLNGVLDMFRQNGMASHAESWLSTGANMGVSGDQVQQVFGASSIGSIAAQLGLSHGQASSAIAQLLPELINQMTPQGQIPDNHQDLLSQGLALLRGRTA